MLVPERSAAASSPIRKVNQHTGSYTDVPPAVERGPADGLEPLKLPPRPTASEPSPSEPRPGTATHLVAAENRPQQRKSKPPPEAPFQPRLFIKNLREAISGIVKGVRGFVQNKEISTTRKVITLGGSAVTVVGAFAYGMAPGLGALTLVLAKLSDHLADNKHSRAYSAVSSSAQIAHFHARGDDDLAVNTETVAGRMLLQSMIPESRTALTLGVTTAGVALSAYLFCSSPGFVPVISLRNAPLLATVLHGFAASLPSKKSALTRQANLICCSVMLPFHCLVSGSAFLAALSAVYLYGTIKLIRERDVPTWRGKDKMPTPEDLGSRKSND